MENMRIILTGAAGFLGSHLSTSLIELGYTVVGLDDLSTGSIKNLEHLNRNPGFQLVHHDVRKPFEYDADVLLNFACPASPVQYQKDPVKTMETNFLGIVNALHLARKKKMILLQASTSEVYGDPTISPQNESYWGNVNPIGIRSCYDEGKRAAETLCFDYKRQYNVDSRVIRIFNTYGPRMSPTDGRVVSNFIVQALKGKEITIFGDGTQSRSFCFVDDLVKGVQKVINLECPIDTPINLGNPREFTMTELADTVIKLTESKSKVIYLPLPSDDPRQRKPDISLAQTTLDWSPSIELEQGLKKTIDYFKRII